MSEENNVSTEDDIESLRKSNEKLKSVLNNVIGLLKEKTNVCSNLEKQNKALITQVASLKDIVSITKNLLDIRNTEVDNMQNDLDLLQEKINGEKERHNTMVNSISNANKLNDDIKSEYKNQMNLFQELRQKYNEKVKLLSQENEKLKNELNSLKEIK